MSQQALSENHLIHSLPPVRGSYKTDAHLAKVTWFKVGGPTDVLYTPADQDDLVHFLQDKPSDTPVLVIGVGSNLLIRDGGIPGVVIRLGPAFAKVEVSDETENQIISGAAALDVKVAKTAMKAGITGLEFLCGVPGTIGGALRMNAGAYGRETKDILVWAEAIDPKGNIKRFTPDQLGYAYRHCDLGSEWIFVRACFAGTPGNPDDIAARMKEIQDARGSTQPIKSRTGGSTFKNPDGNKAWQLIDKAGCRGLKIGDAQVSEQHCNFLINNDKASASDLENLGEEVRKRVKETSGIELHWEIKRLGHNKAVEQ
ncbi:UDP-N-acetylenolpyruvoylglucosamine reductase [Kiloniella litopenaei]|uniref:UDP-N-acetylenolpyruvoylglucosamine reductase n=1 Tax=Kiloniella litopenaei TaxID=1549748 RepID=A0A0M2REK3_9PROT|nr:UDP-N-acetylmuramate dehydrogenase [Kiloniella litopenaei]KKJ78445.1 UDP-N-acetylenolpyruvoylglucosamine reductase [Kiloniella litopenaei]